MHRNPPSSLTVRAGQGRRSKGPSVTPAAEGPGRRTTILLVEDNEDVCEAYSAVLQSLGFHVLAARDGQQALSIWKGQREHIGLVLTDLAMPGMSGMDVYRALREQGITAPVIVLSGYPMPTRGVEGLADWLQKPLEVEELIAAVDRALPGRSR